MNYDMCFSLGSKAVKSSRPETHVPVRRTPSNKESSGTFPLVIQIDLYFQ